MNGLFRLGFGPSTPAPAQLELTAIEAPVLPPVAFVHERLQGQRDKNLSEILNLEKRIADLTEELRQRRVIHEALQTATDHLGADSAVASMHLERDLADMSWAEVLDNVDQKPHGG